MLAQTETAIAQADAVFFMIDARAGPMPDDRAFADLVRRSGKPAIVVANKSEGKARRSRAARSLCARPRRSGRDLGRARRGAGRSVRGAARGACRNATGDGGRRGGERGSGRAADPRRRGRPAELRQVDADQPADRRGAPAHRAGGRHSPATPSRSISTWQGRRFRLHDTAGLRRPSRIEEKLEKLSVADALNAIRFAEVVVLLMDVEHAVRGAGPAHRRSGRARGPRAGASASASGICTRDAPARISKLREQADERLPQVKGVPVVAVSGLTGEGLDRLMQAVVDIHAVWNRRVLDQRAQSLARRGDRGASAAGGVGAAHPAQLHHAAEGAAAELRAVLHPRRRGARRLPALSRQRAAREPSICPARRSG